jgi:fluoride ion exporter CrcB/FEX
LSPKILAAVFYGGAIGSALRYLIFLSVDGASLTEPETALVATSVVNLTGALFLGFVQAGRLAKNTVSLAFWGTGLAGGFTTMSGLTLVTNSQELGSFGNGSFFWLAVALQLVLGVFAYWLGKVIGKGTAGQRSAGGSS